MEGKDAARDFVRAQLEHHATKYIRRLKRGLPAGITGSLILQASGVTIIAGDVDHPLCREIAFATPASETPVPLAKNAMTHPVEAEVPQLDELEPIFVPEGYELLQSISSEPSEMEE